MQYNKNDVSISLDRALIFNIVGFAICILTILISMIRGTIFRIGDISSFIDKFQFKLKIIDTITGVSSALLQWIVYLYLIITISYISLTFIFNIMLNRISKVSLLSGKRTLPIILNSVSIITQAFIIIQVIEVIIALADMNLLIYTLHAIVITSVISITTIYQFLITLLKGGKNKCTV